MQSNVHVNQELISLHSPFAIFYGGVLMAQESRSKQAQSEAERIVYVKIGVVIWYINQLPIPLPK